MPTEAIPAAQADFVLVMGVCGVGKSTVGRGVAGRLGGTLVEADDHHSIDNIQRMASGVPLTDGKRWPWLAEVAAAARSELSAGRGPVLIACSALKRRYRDFLRQQLGALPIVHLQGDADLIRQRLEVRRSHFMPPHLLESQLADLEAPGPDEAGIAVDIHDDPQHLVTEICRRLGLADREAEERTKHLGGKT